MVSKKGGGVKNPKSRPRHIKTSMVQRKAYLEGIIPQHEGKLKSLRMRIDAINGEREKKCVKHESVINRLDEEYDSVERQHDEKYVKVKEWKRELDFIREAEKKI